MPPPRRTHVGRHLSVLAAAIIAAYAAVLIGGYHPQLGLDLQGGTSIILTPRPQPGHSVTQADLNTAVDIIRQRVNGTGVTEARVDTQGNQIVISVPGKGRGTLQSVGSTARLEFREVADSGNPLPPQPLTQVANRSPVTPAPSASPTRAPTPAPGAGASLQPSASSHGRALAAALRAAGGTPTPTASGAPSPSGAAASASPGAARSVAPTPRPSGSAAPVSAAAIAAQLAQQYSVPLSVAQKAVTLDCTSVQQRSTLGTNDDPKQPIVACDKNGQAKYLLRPAAVTGTAVKSASAVLDPQTGQWKVELSFTGDGQSKWTDLTRRTAPSGGNPGKQVAVVLDGIVQSAPVIQNVIYGNAEITGNFSAAEAKDLANVLNYGALPLTFTTSSEQAVSATLGSDQLHAGLLAGAIGLGLVVLYCLLYYRGLGLVAMISLALAGAVTWAAVALLGHFAGLRLSLAGVAGFIVAIGITADSFVVFFERIKDELREGRATLRSAVDYGWVRARRTILSADAVSFLAAVILYFLSIGDVRGFAFTLGLSTVIDVGIVFLFTHPVLVLIARSRTLSRGRLTGMGGISAVRPRRVAQAPREA